MHSKLLEKQGLTSKVFGKEPIGLISGNMPVGPDVQVEKLTKDTKKVILL